jgi:hypothetical protein
MTPNSNLIANLIEAGVEEQPIVGGETAVSLTSASVLGSLGVSVTPLGSAQINTVDGTPVADFVITGGTNDRINGDEVILHQGSGLELKDAAGAIDVSDFRIDTESHLVFADVTVNGVSAGNLAVFDLAANGALAFTSAAAAAVDSALGTTAITASTVVGVADAKPVIQPFSIPLASVHHHSAGSTSPAGGTEPIIGGDTQITLSSASALTSIGVSVKALGFASLDTGGPIPVANIPITGGTEGPGSADVILHQGSGLELKDAAGTVDLSNFIIDTKNQVVDADVSLDGKSVGELAVFNLGANGALTLTSPAAAAVDTTLNTTAITTATLVGTAVASPLTSPAGHLGHEFSGCSAHIDHVFY